MIFNSLLVYAVHTLAERAEIITLANLICTIMKVVDVARALCFEETLSPKSFRKPFYFLKLRENFIHRSFWDQNMKLCCYFRECAFFLHFKCPSSQFISVCFLTPFSKEAV